MKTRFAAAAFMCTFACYVNGAAGKNGVNSADRVLSVDMGRPGCSISLVNSYRGHLESAMVERASYWSDAPPARSSVGDFAINFRCVLNENINDASRTYGAFINKPETIWHPYYQSEDDRKILNSASHVYQLKAKNAVGFLRITDQINGDESQRVRFYTFCLFHDRTAICGDGQSMRLIEPKGNYLPYILRVLRSVKFIDARAGKSNP